MKIKPVLSCAVMMVGTGIPSPLAAFEVHEWGTFTVLVSSSGQTVDWYQPYSDIASLPPFVQNGAIMGKSGIGFARVRMETPVIYFYPEKEMPVSVRVAFDQGQITERFPASTNAPYGINRLSSSISPLSYVPKPTSESIFESRIMEYGKRNQPVVTRWTGNLLPPGHADAKLVPQLSATHGGENYAAARNVPDAWLFRSDAATPFPPNIHPVEKFIFYRGAGQSIPPYVVSMPDDQSVTFDHNNLSDSTFQVALRVRDGKASWMEIPSVPGIQVSGSRSARVRFPEKTMSLAQADQELRDLFLPALMEHGLTKDEAQAMIDTWNHTWFGEPGQRVFTIVDRAWVDSVLPLGITPEPTKTERVFVARFEILSPSSENQIERILSQNQQVKEGAEILDALELGRFRNGAIELVANRIKQRNIQQLHALARPQPTATGTGR